MSPRRSFSHLPVLLIFFAFLASALAQDAAPVEFRSIAGGARLTYSDFLCTAGGGGDLTFACATAPAGDVGRGQIALVGYAAPVGQVTPVGFLRPLDMANVHVKSLTLLPQYQSAIAAMWPLEVGNAATFELEAEIVIQTAGWYGQDKKCTCTIPATARVVGTTSFQVSQDNLQAYVIETTTDKFRIPNASVAALKWTFWYAPALGAPVKMRTEWTQGPMIGGAAESEFWKVDLPTG